MFEFVEFVHAKFQFIYISNFGGVISVIPGLNGIFNIFYNLVHNISTFNRFSTDKMI